MKNDCTQMFVLRSQVSSDACMIHYSYDKEDDIDEDEDDDLDL